MHIKALAFFINLLETHPGAVGRHGRSRRTQAGQGGGIEGQLSAAAGPGAA
jgi:hypothetical protein